MTTYIGYSTIGLITGNTVLTDKDIAVRDLMNHFYTRKGERVMNPEFGSIIWDMVFEPLDIVTESLIKEDVERIIRSDPRWIFSDMILEKPAEHSITVRVQIIYDDTGTAEELFLTYTGEI